VTVTGHIVSY